MAWSLPSFIDLKRVNMSEFYADWGKLPLFVKTIQLHRALALHIMGVNHKDISIKTIKAFFIKLLQLTHPTQKIVNTSRSVNTVKEKKLVDYM